jgi:hypothetical protein
MNYYYGPSGGMPPTSPYDQKAAAGASFYPGQPPSPASAYPSSFSAFGTQAQLQNGYAARQMQGVPSSPRMASPVAAAAGFPSSTGYPAQASMYAPSTIYSPTGLSPYPSVQSMGAPGLYQSAVPQANGPAAYSQLQGSQLSAASPYLAAAADPRQPISTSSNLALAGMRPEYGYPSMGGYSTATSMSRYPYPATVPGYPSSGPMPPNMGGMARAPQMPSYTLVPGGAGSAPAGYSLSTSPYTRPIL